MVYGDRLAESYQQINEQLCRLLREVSKGASTKGVTLCGERRRPGMNETSVYQTGGE